MFIIAQPVYRLGYDLDDRGSLPGKVRGFPLLHNLQTVSGAHLASYPMGTGALSPGVKWQEREADHSPPSSAEVKNGINSVNLL
jgi:hypothetical protein